MTICRTPHSLVKEVTGRFERGQTPPEISRATGLSGGVLKPLVPWLLTATLYMVSLAKSAETLDGTLDLSLSKRHRTAKFMDS